MSNDQRVNRICNSLCDMGFDVEVLARRLKNSPELAPARYSVTRFKLLANKGMLFYASLNLRIFNYMLFHHCDAVLANDLDTLLANSLISKIKGKKLFYDSHELFTEVPELQDSKFKKGFWAFIERQSIRQASASYTVCQSIADFYNKKYNLNMKVVRNLPTRKQGTDYSNRKNILLYQGALNMGRGIETLIEMMLYIGDDYKLYIAGKGYMEKDLKGLVSKLNLNGKVVFTGNLNFSDLHELTSQAKIGFSVERGICMNYIYALPNKIFDYIQAGTPVFCSDLPEMKTVIDNYKVGESHEPCDAKTLADKVSAMLNDEERLQQYHNNCVIAAETLNWENESEILKGIYRSTL